MTFWATAGLTSGPEPRALFRSFVYRGGGRGDTPRVRVTTLPPHEKSQNKTPFFKGSKVTADEAHIDWIAYALIVALAPAAAFADPIPGPINAHVVSVYDGDTLTVEAAPWPGLTARTGVRVAGVDTPEIRGKCQAEKDMAIRARDFVRATVREPRARSSCLGRIRQARRDQHEYGGRLFQHLQARHEGRLSTLWRAAP